MSLCTETVRGTAWQGRQPCPNPAKEDGLCGVHLNARRKRAKAQEERRAKALRSEQNQAKANNAVDALSVLGIGARPVYGGWSLGYTGEVAVDADELLAAIQRGKGR